ncbi:uncharacterized protein E0L32_008292 [Thyridium curvatum]|uniref:Ankyrin 2,3/unc44 n=1 Tax=Thyridium curvatum TaxID=1093900 RepID=A0A507ASL4_9PEZI|nr:uncharacterized protein E0L32_008292 [Thyridium curvatum]TPX10723.1 hypothetical protein E0L32_008292 [Thyridium curvatum]
MSSPVSAIPNLCADDVLAFSDTELVQYMTQNRRQDGGFDLEFDGWEKLPKEQREQLAERLRVGAQKVNDAVQSRPVDPDQLAARLQGVADSEDAAPQAVSTRSRYERTPTEDVDFDVELKRKETIAYNALVTDGCVPVYPISRLDEVCNGLEEYLEILQPWKDPSVLYRWHHVFQNQLWRWKKFRRWQQDNREPDEEQEFAAYLEEQKRQDAEGTESEPTASQYLEHLRERYERRQRHYGHNDGDEGFAAYVEEKKQKKMQYGFPWPGMSEDEYMQILRNDFKKKQTQEGIDAGDEGFAAFVEKHKRDNIVARRRWPGMTEDEYREMQWKRFNEEEDDRYWYQFYWLRDDHGRGGFTEYVAEAKRRLARHGFTKAFEFDRDPTRQDKLTTWIEYLNYEYSWLDKHRRYLTKLQPAYDKGWQKVVDSGVLRHGETAAGFCNIESAFRRQSEEDAVKKAFEDAKQAGTAILEKAMNDPEFRSKHPKPLRVQMMRQAAFKIKAMQDTLTEVKRRSHLISGFVQGVSDHRATTKDLTIQKIRLQWAKEQISLIEAEARDAGLVANGLHSRGRTKRRSEGDQDDNTTDRRRKRRKQSHPTHSSPDILGPYTHAKASEHGGLAIPGDGEPHKEFRGDRQASTKRTKVQKQPEATTTTSTSTSRASNHPATVAYPGNHSRKTRLPSTRQAPSPSRSTLIGPALKAKASRDPPRAADHPTPAIRKPRRPINETPAVNQPPLRQLRPRQERKATRNPIDLGSEQGRKSRKKQGQRHCVGHPEHGRPLRRSARIAALQT